MSRTHLKLLQDCVNNFNKELNPFIKQRKVTVRCEKVRHLLFPAHFIKHGRSTAIQDPLNSFDQFKSAALIQVSKTLTRTLAIRFRDYLITSLVIANGLEHQTLYSHVLRTFRNIRWSKIMQNMLSLTAITKRTRFMAKKIMVVSKWKIDTRLFTSFQQQGKNGSVK